MKSIQALREQRNTAAVALRKLVDDNPGDKWTGECDAKYEAMCAEIENVDKEIARVEKAIQLTGAHRDTIDGLADRDGLRRSEAEAEEEQRTNAFKAWLRGGASALSPEALMANNKAIRSLRGFDIRAAQSEGTNSAGGYLVPTTTVAALLVELKAFGGMRSVATILSTSSGETMNWPTLDDTGNTGELVAENAAAGSQDMTFGSVSLVPYKFSSKKFAVSFELIQDSVVDVDGIVNKAAAIRLGRAQNTYFTTGTGTSQPKGVVVAAASGKAGATGQTTSIIYDDLVDLEHSVDPAYRGMPSVGWMFHDNTLKVLKKLKDGQARPLWLPGLSGLDGPIGRNSLMGYGYTINQDVAVMAASAKSVLFGTFDQYIIRDVMSVLMFRFDDSAFISNGQIGFLAWMRSAGNYVASSNSSMKYYANSAS